MRYISVTGAESGARCLVNLDHVLTMNEVTALVREDNPGVIDARCNTIIGLDASKTPNDAIHARQTIDELLQIVEAAELPREPYPERFED